MDAFGSACCSPARMARHPWDLGKLPWVQGIAKTTHSKAAVQVLHAIRVEKELVGPPLVIGHGSKFLANTTRNVGAASKKPRRINDGRCERISLLAQAPLGKAVVVGVCTQRKGEVGSGSRDA